MYLLQYTEKEFKWANAYINIAKTFAKDVSDDPNTKIGAVIVNNHNRIVSVGVNGFPQRVKHKTERYIRPLKYEYIEHAERNAIYSAKTDLTKTSLYLSTYPCPCTECTKAIIQSGISCVIGPLEEYNPSKNPESKYFNDIDINSPSYQMLNEAGIFVICIDNENKRAYSIFDYRGVLDNYLDDMCL